MLKFQIYTFLGSWPWCFALAYVGMVLGARWDSDPTFAACSTSSMPSSSLSLLAGCAWFVWSRWREVRRSITGTAGRRIAVAFLPA